ncbi:MAG: GAP family protein [Candidatus Bathyarchaeota archaeon]|nr:GAP family protein [Candidatus Bathyarchaeota archaeon]
MIELLATLISLALVDCLNPATIATQAFLLIGTEKPKARAITHAIGVYVAYFMIGFLIIFGLGESLKQLFAFTLGTTEYVILLVLGFVLILFACLMKTSNGGSRIDRYLQKVRTMSPTKTFFFGFFSTFMDIPTAFPYFAAIAILIGVQLSFLGITALLLIYNFIYVLPLLVLVVIYLAARKECATQLQRINDVINKWSGKIAKGFLLVTGILLIAASVAFFLGFPIL